MSEKGCGIALIVLVVLAVVAIIIAENAPPDISTYETACPKCGTKVVLMIKKETHIQTVPIIIRH